MKITHSILICVLVGLTACSSNDGPSSEPAPSTKPTDAPNAQPAPQPAPHPSPRRADPNPTPNQPENLSTGPEYSNPPHPSLRKLVCNQEIVSAGQKLSDAFWNSTGSQALDTWQETVKACEHFQDKIAKDPCNYHVFDQSTGAPLNLDETYSKCSSAYQAVQNLSALPTFQSLTDQRDVTKMPKDFTLIIRSATVFKSLGSRDSYLQSGKVVASDKVDFQQNHCQMVGLGENPSSVPRSLDFQVTFTDTLGLKAVARNTDGIILDCANQSAEGFRSTVSELQSTLGSGLEIVVPKTE